MLAFVTNLYNELTTEGGLKAALGLLWSFILTSAGYPETAIEALVFLLVADFILGFVHAWRDCNLCGSKIRNGAYKFVAYWVAIAIFVQADKTLINVLPGEISLANLLVAYLGVNEALSCLAHLSAFGLPVPEHLIKRLTKYKEKLSEPASTEPNPEVLPEDKQKPPARSPPQAKQEKPKEKTPSEPLSPPQEKPPAGKPRKKTLSPPQASTPQAKPKKKE
ncbi:MAG: phage holin family protein [Clostridiales bacterium]|nr:phage holin family protein [Bacillota bacterium]MCD7802326.1 phage holin family protein [Clostridiales bacterium]